MLRGRFGNTSGRPYLEGRLILPRIDAQGDVSFLVDTGADKTVMMPADARRLGIDYRSLTGSQYTVGVSGLARTSIEPGAVVFDEGSRSLHVYYIDVVIPQRHPGDRATAVAAGKGCPGPVAHALQSVGRDADLQGALGGHDPPSAMSMA